MSNSEQTPPQQSGLNVNAAEFNFNLNASEFVPSFGTTQVNPPGYENPSYQNTYLYNQDPQNMYYNQQYQQYGQYGQYEYPQQYYNLQQPYYYPENQPPEEPEEPEDNTISFSDFENSRSSKPKVTPGPKLGFKSINVGEEVRQVVEQEEAPKEEVKVAPKVRKPVIKSITEKPIDKAALIAKLRESAANEEQPLVEPDKIKEPVNIVFIGHVDSGKSTICGSILLLSGKVDQRIIETYEQEAKRLGRDSWWLAYIMDQTDEEREKGITVEVGKAFFETPTKRFSILDAPGHKAYVPNMIGGASQADYASLVISARISEFETGFDRGGQTREHAMLAKSLGISNLIVVINKMDDPSVNWSQDRFEQIKREMSPFLSEKCKYDLSQVHWIPISGISGANIIERVKPETAPWYNGPTLFEIFDSLPLPVRSAEAPLRIPILDRSKDQGIIIYGKVESGQVVKGQRVIVMPIRIKGEIVEIIGAEESRLMYANAGENVRIKLKVPEEVEIQRGFTICDIHDVCHAAQEFSADVQLLDLLEEKQVVSAGYQCVMHAHTAVEECEILEITALIDVARKKKSKTSFGRSNQRILMRVKAEEEICVEPFTKMNQLGRFTLRDEGKTVGLGKIIEIVEAAEEAPEEEPANK
ncbi:unnamed protein product [Blepharisma stoltei]|uniref:Tr-type G domain-containing protein n=1 Tax=Blepharisma stoltei TaxID=1481888 RepID=A0AAU9J9Z1_9CILI|nr:unnamed protein product [Blepharisma stoltei]